MSERRNLATIVREGVGRGRVVATRDYVLALDEFEHASSLGPDLKRLRGRSVVLSVRDMAKVAAALIDLDGCARRILLAPAGWESWRFDVAARNAEADAVGHDDEDVATPTSIERAVPCRLPLQPLGFASHCKLGNRMDPADFRDDRTAQARQAHATHSDGRDW